MGAGHNGLVAATLLARAGLSVVVLERDSVIGGAARPERPFPRVPGLRQSTGFASELVVAMYAVTDGLSGLTAGPDTPGSGHNFLVHNMCRLPGSDGTWMIVRGGMGTVTATLTERAQAAGATVVADAAVAHI